MLSKLGSKLCGLLYKNGYCVSRQKTLLKRRKMTSKKQKVAKKKFLQHNPEGSYTNQLKILQIQKELDRKVSKNHHLNELMDELFYPDVRYANQQLMQQNLMKLSVKPQQNLTLKQKSNGRTLEENEEEYEQYDELAQQIYLCQIPSQLFQLYLKNSQFFTQRYLTLFLQKLEFYFKNRQTIKERVTEKWKQSLQKLKLTDAQKKKRKRCPYIFILQEELIRDQDWNKIIKDINNKLALSTEHISNQEKSGQNLQSQEGDQNAQSQQGQALDESFYSLENNCELALQIKRVANYLPEEIFESVLRKAFVICGFNEKNDQSAEELPIFSHAEKVKLLKVISSKSFTKSTLTKALYIQSPELSEKQEEKVTTLGRNLCQDILNSPRCSADDVGTVVTSEQGHYKFLTSSLLNLAKPKILQFLSKTSLQRSIDYLMAFWRDGSLNQVNFVEVLLFDIYRKLPFSVSKDSLFSLLAIIKNTRILFGKSGVSVSVASIYPRISESMAKYLNRNLLSHEQVKIFIDSIFLNFPIYKVDTRANILEMAATAIVKMGEGFRLQELTELLFKSTLMGHRSKIFSKYIFQRYQKEYRNLVKQYKQQKIQLIPDKTKQNSTFEEQQVPQVASLKQVLLQQSLVMMLWCYVINLNSQNAALPLNDMIQIYPLYIHSQDLMINDLREDLNTHLKEYNFFPEIKHQSQHIKVKDSRKGTLKNASFFIKTNTYEKYKHQYSEQIAHELIKVIEEGKQPISQQTYEDLVFYLIRYCIIQENKIETVDIPDRWIDTSRKAFALKRQIYTDIYQKFLEEKGENKQSDKDKISVRLKTILETKQSQDKESAQSGKENKFTEKGYKLYELL